MVWTNSVHCVMCLGVLWEPFLSSRWAKDIPYTCHSRNRYCAWSCLTASDHSCSKHSSACCMKSLPPWPRVVWAVEKWPVPKLPSYNPRWPHRQDSSPSPSVDQGVQSAKVSWIHWRWCRVASTYWHLCCFQSLFACQLYGMCSSISGTFRCLWSLLVWSMEICAS